MKNLLFCILFCSCVSITPGEQHKEQLLGFRIHPHGIELFVLSGGCTTLESFRVLKQRHGAVLELGLERIKEDRCEALVPGGTPIFYHWEDLSLQPGNKYSIDGTSLPFVTPPKLR